MSEYKRPYVIFLNNVFPEDVYEDAPTDIDSMMLQNIIGETAPSKGSGGVAEYGKLPPFYTTLAEHQIADMVKCWSCDDFCRDFVWFVPERLPKEHRAKWRVNNAFCDFPCAVGWLRAQKYDDTTYRHLEKNLRELIKEVRSVMPRGHLWTPPDPRATIKEYGRGNMSRENYRREIEACASRTLEDAD